MLTNVYGTVSAYSGIHDTKSFPRRGIYELLKRWMREFKDSLASPIVKNWLWNTFAAKRLLHASSLSAHTQPAPHGG